MGECPLSGVKRTSKSKSVTSAYDAVDGARSAASKCYSGCVESESNKGGQHDRRNADKVDPGIGRTRLGPPHKQAEHMTAPDQCCSYVRKSLPRRRPDHRTLKCALTIGTRSAQSIMASGFTAGGFFLTG